MSKYQKATLPFPDQAKELAESYAEWAAAAREIDKHGTAQLYELVSELLKYYAKNEKESQHEEKDR